MDFRRNCSRFYVLSLTFLRLLTYLMSIERKMWREMFCCVAQILLCSSEEQRVTVKWFNWVLKICPEFQVLTFHFSEVADLLDEPFAKNVQRENL